MKFIIVIIFYVLTSCENRLATNANHENSYLKIAFEDKTKPIDAVNIYGISSKANSSHFYKTYLLQSSYLELLKYSENQFFEKYDLKKRNRLMLYLWVDEKNGFQIDLYAHKNGTQILRKIMAEISKSYEPSDSKLKSLTLTKLNSFLGKVSAYQAKK